jgi:hypothetical protein
MDITLALGGMILLAMICVSGYGWITLPQDALVFVHVGPGRYNNLMAKWRGLVLHPAGGAAVYLSCAIAIKLAPHSASRHLVWAVLLISMCVLLVVQLGAVGGARRRSRGAGWPGSARGPIAEDTAAERRLAPLSLSRHR